MAVPLAFGAAGAFDAPLPPRQVHGEPVAILWPLAPLVEQQALHVPLVCIALHALVAASFLEHAVAPRIANVADRIAAVHQVCVVIVYFPFDLRGVYTRLTGEKEDLAG